MTLSSDKQRLTRNNSQLYAPVLLPGYPFCLFHQQRTKALMLELGRITTMYRHCCPIDVEFSYYTRPTLRAILAN